MAGLGPVTHDFAGLANLSPKPAPSMSTTTTRPALRLAQPIPSPERRHRPHGVVEESLRTAAAWLLRIPHTRLTAHRVATLATTYADDLPSIANIRAQLRHGITPTAAARAFALIRAVSAEQLGLKPYSVQLMAAWSMLRGQMVEFATGEGKTLAASIAAATAALAGRMVHVVTVNDYLAERDHAQL